MMLSVCKIKRKTEKKLIEHLVENTQHAFYTNEKKIQWNSQHINIITIISTIINSNNRIKIKNENNH